MSILRKLSEITNDENLGGRNLRLIRPEQKYGDPSSSVQEVELMMRKCIFSENSDFSPSIITSDAWGNYTDMFKTAMGDEVDLSDSSPITTCRYSIRGIFFKPNINWTNVSQRPPGIKFNDFGEYEHRMLISSPDDINDIRMMMKYFNDGVISPCVLNQYIKVNNYYDIYIMAEDIIYRPAHYLKNVFLYKYSMINYKED